MYEHTQKSPLHLLLYLPAIFLFVIAWQIRNDMPPSVIVGVVAALVFVLAFSFQSLTIADAGDRLVIRYCPLNLFGTTIAYQDMTSVEPAQSSLVDGWGIHFIPFRGWTFNLWGFECVKITLGNKTIRIGTDDSMNLSRYLNQRLSGR